MRFIGAFRHVSDTPQRDVTEMTRLLHLSGDELEKSLGLATTPYLSLFHLLDVEGAVGRGMQTGRRIHGPLQT